MAAWKWIELSKDHDDKYIYETTDLPDKLILSGWVLFEGAIIWSLATISRSARNWKPIKVTGSELMKEKAFRVGHIFNFPVEDINKESAKLVHEHATKWPNEVCHMQKHSLFAIPVNEIVYDIDGEVTRLYPFGLKSYHMTHMAHIFDKIDNFRVENSGFLETKWMYSHSIIQLNVAGASTSLAVSKIALVVEIAAILLVPFCKKPSTFHFGTVRSEYSIFLSWLIRLIDDEFKLNKTIPWKNYIIK